MIRGSGLVEPRGIEPLTSLGLNTAEILGSWNQN
jgi:hypothetical protein